MPLSINFPMFSNSSAPAETTSLSTLRFHSDFGERQSDETFLDRIITRISQPGLEPYTTWFHIFDFVVYRPFPGLGAGLDRSQVVFSSSLRFSSGFREERNNEKTLDSRQAIIPGKPWPGLPRERGLFDLGMVRSLLFGSTFSGVSLIDRSAHKGEGGAAGCNRARAHPVLSWMRCNSRSP